MNNKILKTKKILALSVLAATVTSMNVMAVETVISTATVTVQNAFTFAETSAINFGTIRASAVAIGTANGSATTSDTTAVGADIAVLALASVDGVATSTNGATAQMQTLTPGAAGVYTVAGVAPFSSLTVTLPTAADGGTGGTAPLKLTAATAPPGSAYFWMHTFEATVTSGTATGTAYGGGNLTADVNGDASFTVGATLATSDPATTVVQAGYQDLAYTGNYTITVDY